MSSINDVLDSIEDYQVLTSEGLFHEVSINKPNKAYVEFLQSKPEPVDVILAVASTDIGEAVFNHTVNETNGNS